MVGALLLRKSNLADKRIYYGGQAVLEGVMIRGPRTMAVACRRPDGEITVRAERLGGVYAGPIRRFPLIRGAIVMWETLALGIRSLIFSSNVAMGEEEKGVDSGAMWATAGVSLLLVTGLFFVLPPACHGLVRRYGRQPPGGHRHRRRLPPGVDHRLRRAHRPPARCQARLRLPRGGAQDHPRHGARRPDGSRATSRSTRRLTSAAARASSLTVVVVSVLVFALVGDPGHLAAHPLPHRAHPRDRRHLLRSDPPRRRLRAEPDHARPDVAQPGAPVAHDTPARRRAGGGGREGAGRGPGGRGSAGRNGQTRKRPKPRRRWTRPAPCTAHSLRSEAHSPG